MCSAEDPQPVAWGRADPRGGDGLPTALLAALPGRGSGQGISLPHMPRRPNGALDIFESPAD